MSKQRISPMLSIFASASVSLPPFTSLSLSSLSSLLPSSPSSLSLFFLSLSIYISLSHSLLFPIPEPLHPFSLFSFYCFCLSTSLCVRESLIGASGLLHIFIAARCVWFIMATAVSGCVKQRVWSLACWSYCMFICYVIWLFVKRLSQEAIQRRSQRDRLVKIKVFKLRRDADDIPCNITLRSAGGESFHSAGPTTAKARFWDREVRDQGIRRSQRSAERSGREERADGR